MVEGKAVSRIGLIATEALAMQQLSASEPANDTNISISAGTKLEHRRYPLLARSHPMGLNKDIAFADEYIAKASKNIEKQRRVLTQTRNPQTIARARNLLDLLTALRANVERQSQTLKYQNGIGALGKRRPP